MNNENLKIALQEMDEYEFEYLVADLWELEGWNTTVSQASNDEGIDVTAVKDSPFDRKELIQAKRYADGTSVGGPEIQQYASLQLQEPDVDSVAVVTTSTFTKPAERTAKKLNVKLVDGDLLVEMIQNGSEEIISDHLRTKDLATAEPESTISISAPHSPLLKAAEIYPEEMSAESLRKQEQLRQLLDFSTGSFGEGMQVDIYFSFDLGFSSDYVVSSGEEVDVYYQYRNGKHILKNLNGVMIENLESVTSENGLTISGGGSSPSDERIITANDNVVEKRHGMREIQIVDLIFSEVYIASFSDIERAVLRKATDPDRQSGLSDIEKDEIEWPNENPDKLNTHLALSQNDLKILSKLSDVAADINEEQIRLVNNEIAASAHRIVNHEYSPDLVEYLSLRRKFLEMNNDMDDMIYSLRLVLIRQPSSDFSEKFSNLLQLLETLGVKKWELIQILDKVINTQIADSSEVEPGILTEIEPNQIKLLPAASARSWEEMKRMIENGDKTSVTEVEEKISDIPKKVSEINKIQKEFEVVADEVIATTDEFELSKPDSNLSGEVPLVSNIISRIKLSTSWPSFNESLNGRLRNILNDTFLESDENLESISKDEISRDENGSESSQTTELVANAFDNSITKEKLTHVGNGNFMANYVSDKPIIEYLNEEEQPHYLLFNESNGIEIDDEQIKAGIMSDYRNSLLVTNKGVHFFVGREKGDFHEFLSFNSICSSEEGVNWLKHYVSLKSGKREYYFKSDRGNVKQAMEYIRGNI